MSTIGSHKGVNLKSNYEYNIGYGKKTVGSKGKSSHVSGENPLKKLKPTKEHSISGNKVLSEVRNNFKSASSRNAPVISSDGRKSSVGNLLEEIHVLGLPKLTSAQKKTLKTLKNADYTALRELLCKELKKVPDKDIEFRDTSTMLKDNHLLCTVSCKIRDKRSTVATKKTYEVLIGEDGKLVKPKNRAYGKIPGLLGPDKAWMADHFDQVDIPAVEKLLGKLNESHTFIGTRGEMSKYLLMSKLPKAIQEVHAKYPKKAIDKVDVETWVKFMRIDSDDYMGEDSTLNAFPESGGLFANRGLLNYMDDGVAVYSMGDEGDPGRIDLDGYLQAKNGSGRMNKALRLKLAIDCYDTQVRPLRTGRHVPGGINHIPTKKEFLDILMRSDSKGGKVKTWAEAQLQGFLSNLKLGVSYDCNLLRLKYGIPANGDGTLKDLNLTPAQTTALLESNGDFDTLVMAEDGKTLLRKHKGVVSWDAIDESGKVSYNAESGLDIGKCGKPVDVNIVNGIDNGSNSVININGIDDNYGLDIESKLQKLPTKKRSVKKAVGEKANAVKHPLQDLQKAVVLNATGLRVYGRRRYPNVSFWLDNEKLDIGQSDEMIRGKLAGKDYSFSQYCVFVNYLNEYRKANLKENANLDWNDIQVSASKEGQNMKVKVLIPFLSQNAGDGSSAYSTRVIELTVPRTGSFTTKSRDIAAPSMDRLPAEQQYAYASPKIMYTSQVSYPSFDRYNMAEDGKTILCSYANSRIPPVAILQNGTIVSMEDFKRNVTPTPEQYGVEAGFGKRPGSGKLAKALGLKWYVRGTPTQSGPHKMSTLKGYKNYLETNWELNGKPVGRILISPDGKELVKVGERAGR